MVIITVMSAFVVSIRASIAVAAMTTFGLIVGSIAFSQGLMLWKFEGPVWVVVAVTSIVSSSCWLGVWISYLFIQSIRRYHHQKEKLIQDAAEASRFTDLGRFASGMAHEINNPLGIVLGNIELMQMEVADQSGKLTPSMILDDFSNRLQAMENGVVRIEKIVRIFRTIADVDSNTNGINEWVSLTDLLDRALAQCHDLNSDRSIHFEVINQAPHIAVNGKSDDLSQVIRSLLVNSIQAIHNTAKNELGAKTKTRKILIEADIVESGLQIRVRIMGRV